MTARRVLPPQSEISKMLDLWRDRGLPIGAVDIRKDGITIHPPASKNATAYDTWKAQDTNSERPSHRR